MIRRCAGKAGFGRGKMDQERNNKGYLRQMVFDNNTILNLKGAIECLGSDQGRAFEILQKNLNLLGDMKYVYTQADTMQKREFISMVFDNNLYYQEGIYRTYNDGYV